MGDDVDAISKADADYIVSLFYGYAARAARAVFIAAITVFLLWIQSHPGPWPLIAGLLAVLSLTNVTKWASMTAVTALLLLWIFPGLAALLKVA